MKRWLAASLAALLLAPAVAFAQAVPYGVTNTRTSGAVATAGTFQQVFPQIGGPYQRRGCQITNTSANVEQIDTGPTPSSTTARTLAAGSTFECSTNYGTVLLDQINITSTTAGSTYVAWSQQ